MKKAISALNILMIALLGVSVAFAADHASEKIARDLAVDLDRSNGERRVIITYRSDVADRDIADLRGRGRGQLQKLEGAHGLTGALDAATIREMAADPRIESISPDRPLKAHMDVAIDAIGADRVVEHLGFNGQGITVALLDSGLTPSADVSADRILASLDFTGDGAVEDGLGHGTHIAGIIGGSGENGAVQGVAPGVDFVSLRVLDDAGDGYASSVIRAIDWAIKNREAYGIRVLNMSLGHNVAESYRTDPLTRAVEKAWASGLVVIASAGNRGRDGYMTINSPGNDPYIITIGAMNDLNTPVRTDDLAATYSSRGP